MTRGRTRNKWVRYPLTETPFRVHMWFSVSVLTLGAAVVGVAYTGWAWWNWYLRKQLDLQKKRMRQDYLRTRSTDVTRYYSLPDHSLSDEDILLQLCQHLTRPAVSPVSHIDVYGGRMSGAVYHHEAGLIDLQTQVFQLTSGGNPLHADAQGEYLELERQIVNMVGSLFQLPTGDSHHDRDDRDYDHGCGLVTSGGTDSIIHACLAYREYGKRVKGITRPNMVIPRSAHAAFFKAAEMFHIEVRIASLHPETLTVDVEDMYRLINRSTIMLVGSAPSYAHGLVDPIIEIAERCCHKYNSAYRTDAGLSRRKADIPLHVDACLGSMVIPFAAQRDLSIPTFDMSIPEVTSMSVDMHKYGYTPKGSSVLLYRDREYRHHQMFTLSDWQGGVYSTPSIPGTRVGHAIATTWATLVKMGEKEYEKAAHELISLREQLQLKIVAEIPQLAVCGNPRLTVLAFQGRENNDDHHANQIYGVADEMKKRGWELHSLQHPASIHFCLTLIHVRTPNFVNDFVRDLAASVEIMYRNHVITPPSSTVKLYGTLSSIPREFVDELAREYWDLRM